MARGKVEIGHGSDIVKAWIAVSYNRFMSKDRDLLRMDERLIDNGIMARVIFRAKAPRSGKWRTLSGFELPVRHDGKETGKYRLCMRPLFTNLGRTEYSVHEDVYNELVDLVEVRYHECDGQPEGFGDMVRELESVIRAHVKVGSQRWARLAEAE